jgi:hypothetical protein
MFSPVQVKQDAWHGVQVPDTSTWPAGQTQVVPEIILGVAQVIAVF